MLEFYQAYADYRDLMDLTDELMRELTQRACAVSRLCIRVLSWTSPNHPSGSPWQSRWRDLAALPKALWTMSTICVMC